MFETATSPEFDVGKSVMAMVGARPNTDKTLRFSTVTEWLLAAVLIETLLETHERRLLLREERRLLQAQRRRRRRPKP